MIYYVDNTIWVNSQKQNLGKKGFSDIFKMQFLFNLKLETTIDPAPGKALIFHQR